MRPVFHLRLLKPINVFIKSKAKEVIKVNPSISAFIYVTYAGVTSGKSLLNAARDLNNMGYKVLGGFKVVAPHFWSSFDNFPKIDKSKCIHCFHCVNICPKNAITSDIEKAKKIVEKNRRIVGIEIPQNHIY